MGRQPCCEKSGLKRGPWTIEEDHKLMNFILNNGIQCWRVVPKLAGLLRCGKSCRLRWINYLRPDLKRGALTEAEEDMIIQLHSHLGNRWSKIAAHFPGRTDNEIKNHWNTRIKKKLKLLGLDPLTHKPIEQHEIKREVLPQSSSSIEQGNMVLEFSNNIVFQDHQKLSESKETYNSSVLDEEIKLAHISKMPARLDVGSILSQNKDTIFDGGMDIEPQPEDNLRQYWINSPMSWNVFNHLEHDDTDCMRKSAEH